MLEKVVFSRLKENAGNRKVIRILHDLRNGYTVLFDQNKIKDLSTTRP